MVVCNILQGKMQLLEGYMTKKSIIPVGTAAMLIYNNGRILPSFAIHAVQFWITASYMSGSWNFLCSNECCPTEQVTGAIQEGKKKILTIPLCPCAQQ